MRFWSGWINQETETCAPPLFATRLSAVIDTSESCARLAMGKNAPPVYARGCKSRNTVSNIARSWAGSSGYPQAGQLVPAECGVGRPHPGQVNSMEILPDTACCAGTAGFWDTAGCCPDCAVPLSSAPCSTTLLLAAG